jgi:hypothetical protein
MPLRLIAFMSVGLLAACGADGPPRAPAASPAPAPGLTISGEASIGVAGTL